MDGYGSPNNAVTAAPGSTFSRTDGVANATFFVKESASDSTGWVDPSVNLQLTTASNDVTPTVRGATTLVAGANGSPTAITQLDNGVAGQVVTIMANSSLNPPTIADSGNFMLSAAWNPGLTDTITLMTPDGSTWYEIARSDN
jgi:hypothetical protein